MPLRGSTRTLPVTQPGGSSGELPVAVRVPQHVVYRDFAAETVVLNLNTGT